MTVPDRTSATLLSEIQKHINPESTIISDSFSSYHILQRNGYDHQMVNHSQNFVDPQTGAHTQNIERMWRSLKEQRKRYNGVPSDEVDVHISEFIWRKNEDVNFHNSFRKTIELIRSCKYY